MKPLGLLIPIVVEVALIGLPSIGEGALPVPAVILYIDGQWLQRVHGIASSRRTHARREPLTSESEQPVHLDDKGAVFQPGEARV